MGSLSISGSSGAWSGKLDLADNDLDVKNGSLADLTNQVAEGSHNGAWNGNGITSLSAAADTTHLTALGVIQDSTDGTTTGSVLYSKFDTATGLTATDVLVKYTYYGDANLDGTVDASDYSRIDSGFVTPGATGWFNGDFNGDGVIDGSDYTLIDNAFNTQGQRHRLGDRKPAGQFHSPNRREFCCARTHNTWFIWNCSRRPAWPPTATLIGSLLTAARSCERVAVFIRCEWIKGTRFRYVV